MSCNASFCALYHSPRTLYVCDIDCPKDTVRQELICGRNHGHSSTLAALAQDSSGVERRWARCNPLKEKTTFATCFADCLQATILLLFTAIDGIEVRQN